MGFNQLHLHTNFSILDGVGSSLEYAKKALELGHSSVAITDHGRLSGWYEHEQACKKTGVKPVFGLEQYVCDESELFVTETKGKTEKRVRIPNNHLVLLAKNQTGYINLMKLHYISTADERHYYYNNHSSYADVFAHKEGLIVGTACLGSPFANALREGNEEKAERLLDMFLNEFKDDMYAELQFNELISKVDKLEKGQKTVNAFISQWADKHGVPKVITGDVHYVNRDDYIIQNIAIAMRSKKTVSDSGTFEIESKTLYYHDVQDYKTFNANWGYGYTDSQIEEMCNNTQFIVDRCNVSIPKRERMILPEVSKDDEKEVVKLSQEGLCKKLEVETFEDVPEEYKSRYNKELDLFRRKGFFSYVMILKDIFDFAKKEDIMTGFARGSAGGSLILYSLDITKVDPIKHELLFERFLSDSRCPNTGYSYFKEFDE